MKLSKDAQEWLYQMWLFIKFCLCILALAGIILLAIWGFNQWKHDRDATIANMSTPYFIDKKSASSDFGGGSVYIGGVDPADSGAEGVDVTDD